MTVTPMRLATLLAALAAAWQPSKAFAAEEDTQFWLSAFARTNLSKDVFFTFDTSLRVREDAVGPDQQTFRFTVEKQVADGIRIGGGAAIFETDGQTEFRPHQQARFTTGGLELRTRFEQRFFPGADQSELRLRQRVQYTHELSDKVDLLGSAEWFGVLQARNPGRQEGTEQVRLIAATDIGVSKALSVQPGYLMWYGVQEGRTDTISHVAQLTLNYRF